MYVTGVVLVLHLYSDIQYLFLCRYRQTLKRLKLNFVNSGNVSLFFRFQSNTFVENTLWKIVSRCVVHCVAHMCCLQAMMTSGDRVVTSARHMEVGCHRVKARHQELAHVSASCRLALITTITIIFFVTPSRYTNC